MTRPDRIGDILLHHDWVTHDELASALGDQQVAGKRVLSLLVIRGHLDPDLAARALAEQFGVAAALTKHLENRERALAKLLPASVARQSFALPLGQMRDGEIVICVRDPRPQLQAAFERMLQKPVLITVACAHALEPLIDLTYPPTQDVAVRFRPPTLQPGPNLPPAPAGLAAGTQRPTAVPEEHDVVIDSGPLVMPQLDPMPETFSLVDLDDASVSKVYTEVDTKMSTALPPGAGAARAPTLPPPDSTRTPATKKP